MQKTVKTERHGKPHNKNDKNKTENTSVAGRKTLSLWETNTNAI